MIKFFYSFCVFCYLLINIAIAQSFDELEKNLSSQSNVEVKLADLNKAKASFLHANVTEQASYWNLLALVQQQNSLFQQSIDSASQSIRLIENHNKKLPLLLARNYIVRSNSLYRVDSSLLSYCDDIDKAVDILLEIATEQARLATTLSSQSTCVYEKTKDVPQALAILDQAIDLAQQSLLKDEEQATIYNETALIYRKLSIFDKAYQYNLIAKNKWLLAADYQGVYFMLRNLIVAATDMAEYILAQQHIDELLSFAQQHPEFTDLPFFANYHAAVLARAQNKWPLAISYFHKAVELRTLTSHSAYIRAAYEQLSLMYFRDNQLTESFETLNLLEKEYPGLPPIKIEAEPLILMKSGLQQASLNKAFELLGKSEYAKREFIKKSTAIATQIHNGNLEQLDNLLLEQRFNYLAVIAFLVVVLLISFSYLQVQRRNTLTQEKETAAALLKQKNQLLADVSHELGTPLTVLKLQVESLKDDLEEDIQVSYDALDNKLDDIQHLIDDIHQLAQSDIGVLQLNKTTFELNNTLSDWKFELKQLVKQRQLTFELKKELPADLQICFDKERLKQVLTNLLMNSVKYTNKPGRVILEVVYKKDWLYFSMSDTAPGVSEEELSSIFERLYRVEASRSRETGGSGLGLSICKSLIEAHSGEIYAEHSTLGGLKVVCKLPTQPIH